MRKARFVICPHNITIEILVRFSDVQEREARLKARIEELADLWELRSPDYRRGSGLAYGDAAQALRAALDERKEA